MRSPRHSVPVPIAIIGRSHASEFRMLVRQIQNSADLNIVGQFEAIQGPTEKFSAKDCEESFATVSSDDAITVCPSVP